LRAHLNVRFNDINGSYHENDVGSDSKQHSREQRNKPVNGRWNGEYKPPPATRSFSQCLPRTTTRIEAQGDGKQERRKESPSQCDFRGSFSTLLADGSILKSALYGEAEQTDPIANMNGEKSKTALRHGETMLCVDEEGCL